MGSTQRSMCAAMLVLQAVVLGLTTPVMISVSDVAVGTALWVGLGLTVACIVTAGLLRRPGAYALGWAIQAASIGLGFVVTMMFFLGVIFASLWAGAYFLGRRIDEEKAQRAVLEERWATDQGGGGSV
jgi:high-affinity Fe2+/Pb2+ permease